MENGTASLTSETLGQKGHLDPQPLYSICILIVTEAERGHAVAGN